MNTLHHLNKLPAVHYNATNQVVPIAQAFHCRVKKMPGNPWVVEMPWRL